MSISREIWRRASPSNKRLFLRSRRRAPVALIALALLAFAAAVPWAEAVVHLRERSEERAALAPLVAQARKESLTFPQVVVSHPAHLNKIVYWNVTVQSSTSSYAEGRMSWPIVWTNPERVSKEMEWHASPVIARVAGVRDDVVYLDFLGRP